MKPIPATIALILGLLIALAIVAHAEIVNLTCDPCTNAAGYTVYVVSQGSTNTVSYSSNVFMNVNVPSGGYVDCTETDTNNFESEHSSALFNNSVKPLNFRRK